MSVKGISLLPSGWAEATLPDLVGPGGLITDGDWVETEDQDPNGDVRLTQLADVGDGVFRDRSNRFMTSKRASELNCTFLKPGDVMIARMPDPLGRACIFPGSKMPCVTVVDVCIVRPAKELSSRWLMSFVNAPVFRVAVANLQSGSTRKRISKANLSTVPIRVPPKEEQVKIADAVDACFTRLDDAVATLERVQRNLKRYRASVLKAAVEGRLVPTEAELARAEKRDYEPASELLKRILVERRRRWEEAELAKMKASGKTPNDDKWKARYEEPASPDASRLPELPKGWCWATVDMVGDVLLGRQRAPQYLTGKHSRPYLRVANIKDDHIDFSDVETMDFDDDHFAKYRLREGDILVSEGQSLELVGQSAIYRDQIEGLCFQKTLHRFRPAVPGPSAEFAQIVFRSHVKTGYFKSLASITTNIAHLTLERFKAARFPLPPAAEQVRIVQAAEKLLSVIVAQEESVTIAKRRCQRVRQGILKWAFEGKLVDQDPNDEPASALLERIRTEQAAASQKTTPARQPRRTSRNA